MSTDTVFAQLGVPPPLASALKAMRFVEPFEIQALTIPDALDGRDILGRAPTGSGKTIAFGVPALARMSRAASRRPTGLILAPTRELAEQIRRELDPLAKSVKRSTLAVYGGKGLTEQRKSLSKGVDLLVACPGRLLDLIDQGAVALNAVEVAVVDEADRMADMGFLPDVSKILDLTPAKRQTMLYSATLDRDVQVLVDTYQNDPVEHAVGELEPDLSLLTQRFVEVPKTDRIWLAADLITDLGTTIVFARTRHGVDRLARQLQRHGVKAGYIHGGRSQSQRDRALNLFTSGKVQVLVATDVAARGIHVDGVECVIHYDPPADEKDYVHRSGRTARAGASGVVVSFLDRPQVGASKKMQKKLGLSTKLESAPDRRHFLDPVTTTGKSGRPAKSKSSRPAKVGTKSGDGRGEKATRKSTPDRTSPDSRRGRAKARDSQSHGGSEETIGSRRPPQRKPRSKSGSNSNSNSNSASGRNSNAKSAKPSKPRKAKTRSDGEADHQPSGKQSSGNQSSGKAKAKKNKKPKQRAGSRSGKAHAAGRPKSKRSGKPRPKNRKNKAGGARRS